MTAEPFPSDVQVMQTRDGLALLAQIDGPSSAPDAVVVVHGFTADRRNAQVRAMVAALAAAGHAVVSYDARGHGESEGSCTLGHEEALDVAAAVDLAATLAPRVVVVGASMGAIAALRYAAGPHPHEKLAGVVTVSCPARWKLRTARTALAALLTQTGAGRRFLRRTAGVRLSAHQPREQAPEDLAALVRCPLAVVHGLDDRFLPSFEATRLHDRGTGRRRIDLVPAMGHAFHPSGSDTIVAAVAWCLVPATESGG